MDAEGDTEPIREMESKPTNAQAAEPTRLELVDELDLLERQNLDRRLVSVVMGLFTVSLIFASSTASFAWGVGAVLSFAVFLALMVAPIRRFQRIAELREQLTPWDTEGVMSRLEKPGQTDTRGLQRGVEADASNHSVAEAE